MHYERKQDKDRGEHTQVARTSGMKQREVARRMGVSEAAISYLENDQAIPNLKQMEDLGDILGITVVMLIEGPEKFYTGAGKG